MTILEKYETAKAETAYAGFAKRITENLMPITREVDLLSKRWPFELIQNASDLGREVDLIVKIEKSKLIFSHNGPTFTFKEALNLIFPDSSKDNVESNKDQIGKYGTGFISTHILSKKIDVSGYLKEGDEIYSFNIKLNRNDLIDKEYYKQRIRHEEIKFKESLSLVSNYDDNEMNTTFTYDLTQSYSGLDVVAIVNDGLKELCNVAPYLVLFRKYLNSIKVIDSRSPNNTYFKFTEQNCEENNFRTVIETNHEGYLSHNYFYLNNDLCEIICH